MTLARDRMGEKPLYYSIQNNSLIFASELKSLTKASGFKFKICPNALNLYFQHGYIPGPQSIYKKVNKLSPGHLIEFSQLLPTQNERANYTPLPHILSKRQMGMQSIDIYT